MSLLADIAKHTDSIARIARRPPGLYARMRAQMQAEDALDLSARMTMQKERLERVIQIARKVPYYDFLPADAQLRDVPILDKETVRANARRFRPRMPGIISKTTTSGTTGVPMPLFRSPGAISWEQATIDHIVSLCGIEPVSARIFMLRADDIKAPDDLEPPFWKVASRYKAVASSQHLCRETVRHYIDFIRDFKPDILFALPSSASLLVSLLEAEGVHLNIPLSVISSEVAPADLRRGIREHLNGEMIDLYGQGERLAFAWSTENGKFHFRPDYGAVEFQNDTIGTELIATGLQNRAMPLLRYNTGDIVLLPDNAGDEQLQHIAFGTAPFRGISGRVSEYIQMRGGRRILSVHNILRDLPGVAVAQIVQHDFERIEIILIPTGDFADQTLNILQKNIKNILPAEVRWTVSIEQVPRRNAAGKCPLLMRLFDDAV
ncbi:MAG: hypothetical protein KDJ29_10485 [Hyphomicrobiales bacterium]|nr:hypothetical protein [Hyphomicrobiales bacterium]